ncbi:MAG: dihydroneopterin aldolase [Candidatus Cloacimonetes bacterium]|nr:dihydroneopterin aldolase [Candidatus Cloacimonadota bacterium]
MKIKLNNMVFYGYHGTHAEERKLGQRYNVDIILETDPVHDQEIRKLEDTVDYTQVFELIRNVMETHSYHLMENCANQVLNELFKQFPEVLHAEISIRKPSVAISGSLDSAEIVMDRSRC